MEKKLMMPANYNVLSQDEMTYTEGGADAVDAISGAVSLAIAGLSIYNYIWGLSQGRQWMKAHKNQSASDTIDNAMNDFHNYVQSSLFNAVRGIYTAVQYIGCWPITALVLLTA